MIPQILAVINAKGGTLKTAIAANLAAFLALFGYRVLVISMDPQGDLLREYGLRGTPANDQGKSLYDALTGTAPLRWFPTGRKNVDIVAGGDLLDDLQVDPMDLYFALHEIAGQWDLIVLDCPPGNKAIQKAALTAAKWVLIPSKADTGSLEDGAGKIGRLFREVRGTADSPGVNPDIELIGVVLTDIPVMSRKIRREVSARVEKLFGSAQVLLSSVIRHAHAPAVHSRDLGKVAHELDRGAYDGTGERFPTSAPGLAGDHERLAYEVTERLGQLVAAAEAALNAELAEVSAP